MNHTEHLLTCLAEESAEVAQRATKALRFGLREVQSGQFLTNAQRLKLELLDLYAVVELLEARGCLEGGRDSQVMDEKKVKVTAWMDYSVGCGTFQI